MREGFALISLTARESQRQGVILLIDAEHSQLQPAVRLISLAMMADFNGKGGEDVVVLCNTYQCYLKGTLDAVEEDLKVQYYVYIQYKQHCIYPKSTLNNTKTTHHKCMLNHYFVGNLCFQEKSK